MRDTIASYLFKKSVAKINFGYRKKFKLLLDKKILSVKIRTKKNYFAFLDKKMLYKKTYHVGYIIFKNKMTN